MEVERTDKRKRKYKQVLRQFAFWLSPPAAYLVSEGLESINKVSRHNEFSVMKEDSFFKKVESNHSHLHPQDSRFLKTG